MSTRPQPFHAPQSTPERDAPRVLAALMGSVGTPALGQAMLDFLHLYAAFDSALILLYHRRRRPRVLVEALTHPLRRNDAADYLAGAYLLDPFRTHAQGLREAAVVRLSDIAPPDFIDTEYYRTYYIHSQLSDEINFLVPVAASQVVAVCLGRSRALPTFDAAELSCFSHWLPLVSATLRRHVMLEAPGSAQGAPEAEDREHLRLEARLAAFGSGALTRREHEVVQHLLRGLSAPEVAVKLNLSVQTVRVHRRNIYGKLEISSLGQLFSMAMGALLAEGS